MSNLFHVIAQCAPYTSYFSIFGRKVPCVQTNVKTDRQTDMTKLIVAFRNFANAPKNNIWIFQTTVMCDTVLEDLRQYKPCWTNNTLESCVWSDKCKSNLKTNRRGCLRETLEFAYRGRRIHFRQLLATLWRGEKLRILVLPYAIMKAVLRYWEVLSSDLSPESGNRDRCLSFFSSGAPMKSRDSSYKHVSDFGRLRSYGHFLLPVHALVWTASYGTSWRVMYSTWWLIVCGSCNEQLAQFTTERQPVLRLAVEFSKTNFKHRSIQIKDNFTKLTLHLYFKCIMYYAGLLFFSVYCK